MANQSPNYSSKPITLGDLRVYQLKEELEKRGLDKSGIKIALVERLEAALRVEGNDPKTYVFCSTESGTKNTPLKHDLTADSTEQGLHSDADITKNESKEQIEEEEKTDSLTVAYITNKVKEEDANIEESHLERDAVCDSKEDIHEVDELKDYSKMENDGKDGLTVENVSSVDGILSDDKDSKEATIESVELTRCQTTNADAQNVITSISVKIRSLWIKGISVSTKAAEIKALCLKYGRVTTAKIFTRRQQPSSTCYGYVTMESPEAADLCVKRLNKATYKGRLLIVERADRSAMPSIKAIQKKNAIGGNTGATSGGAPSIASIPTTTSSSVGENKADEENMLDAEKKEKKEESHRASDEKVTNKRSSSEKVKLAAGDSSSTIKSSGKKTLKSEVASVKKTEKTHPTTPGETTGSPNESGKIELGGNRKLIVSHGPPVYRGGRRVYEREAIFPVRRTTGPRRKMYLSTVMRHRAFVPDRSFISNRSRGKMRQLQRREVSSRRVEATTAWNKREMMELMRKREEEHRLKEQELKLLRERERIKFERERIERERLELQQLRMATATFAPPQQVPIIIPTSRRSHETYTEVGSSSRRRNERNSGSRVPSHRNTSSISRSSNVERQRESSRVSGRHDQQSRSSVSGRDRSRDRSKHSGVRSRNYISSSQRNTVRDSHHSSCSRGSETGRVGSTYDRDTYRVDSDGSNHRGDPGYSGRDINYNSSGTFGREIPSSFNKDMIGYNSSRSLGNSSAWENVGSPSSFVGGSRDYNTSSTWIPSAPQSQHGTSSASGWQSFGRTKGKDLESCEIPVHGWNAGSSHYSTQDMHGGSSYDKYDAFYKYGRKY